ncbi:MAG: TauD/TfdA dioxygenase family protein [Methyloligellaceae bacterium]
MTDIEVKRLTGPLGAEICGAELSDTASNEAFATIHQAFLDHSVLVFRNQRLEPDELVGFSRKFGPLEQHVLEQFTLPENPDVLLISNVKEKGKPVGAIRAGQYWHSDCSYMEHPTQASLLHAQDVPSYGGDTIFASMACAYDELSDTMKGFLGGLRAVHDYTNAYDTFFSKFPDRPPLSKEERAKVPPVEHPVVRTHPETGRKALYVNPGFTRSIVGMTDEESRAILDFLFVHAQQPHFIYRHIWAPGDLVIWDNRATWHLAVADYDMDERRHLLRTTIAGDKPY